MAHRSFISIALFSLFFSINIACLFADTGSEILKFKDAIFHGFAKIPEHEIERDTLDIDRGIWNSISGTSFDDIENMNIDPLPPSNNAIAIGRYTVNHAIWSSVATISTYNAIKGFPFVNVVAISDGPVGNGTGIPYIYLTPFDFTGKDIEVSSITTFMITLAQGNYCTMKNMDPIDPRCARIILSGNVKKISRSNEEYKIASEAIFNRHPYLVNMPSDHKFFVAKLNISFVAVIDTYGGAKIIPVENYLNFSNKSNSIVKTQIKVQNEKKKQKLTNSFDKTRYVIVT